MPAYIVTYDTHPDRNQQRLYDAMEEIGGVRLAGSVWGVSSVQSVSELRDWVKALLDDDDTVVVVRLQRRLAWATRNAAREATDWLHTRGR